MHRTVNWREACLLHAKSKSFKVRVEKAHEIINSAFNTSLPWYIALSGGKDSTVVFELLRSLQPDILCLWSDEEWYLPETLEYIERLHAASVNLVRIKGPVRHTQWFTSNQDSGLPGKTQYAKDRGYTGVFLGLRAEENRYRREHLKHFGQLHFAQNRDMWLCNPIAWWSVLDVWAYIYSTKADYNRAYDRLAEIGIAPDRQRIGPFATERALGYGQLAILKMGWPEKFMEFTLKYPEAAQFV